MSLSDLMGNKFWDNSDPKGEKHALIFDTDRRQDFLSEFSKWSESYCTKNTHWQAKPLGLFGTGSGMELILKSGNIKKSENMSIGQLVKKFGEENNIPVYTSGYKVFSNKYSLCREEELGSSSSNKYSTKLIDAYEEVYGKPMYLKTDEILGTLSEYLENFNDDEFMQIFNYNYVGYIANYNHLLKQALKEMGIDFDVIKQEKDQITIQEDDYDLLRKFEFKVKKFSEESKY